MGEPSWEIDADGESLGLFKFPLATQRASRLDLMLVIGPITFVRFDLKSKVWQRELDEPVGSCLKVANLAAVGNGYGLPPVTFRRLETRRLSGRGVALRAGLWRGFRAAIILPSSM